MSSKFWTLSEKSRRWFINFRNVAKGAMLAIISGVCACITQNSVDTISWKVVGYASLSAFAGYLITKFFQNEDGNLKKQFIFVKNQNNMMVDPIFIKIFTALLSVMMAVIAFFLVRFVSVVDKINETMKQLSEFMSANKVSCPLIHKEIDRRLEILEKKIT